MQVFARHLPFILLGFLVLLGQTPGTVVVGEQCLADSALNDIFIPSGETQIPLQGSCCQADVCGLACPEEVDPPAAGKTFFLLLRMLV